MPVQFWVWVPHSRFLRVGSWGPRLWTSRSQRVRILCPLNTNLKLIINVVCCCVNFRARSLCTCFRLPAAGGPLLTSFVPFRKSPLTPAHSHSSSHSRPHPLSFHIHPQNTREVRSFSQFFTPRSFHDPQLSASLFSIAPAFFHFSYTTLLLPPPRLAHSCPRIRGYPRIHPVSAAPVSTSLSFAHHLFFSRYNLRISHKPAITTHNSPFTAHRSFFHHGKMETPVPRRCCAAFYGVPILAQTSSFWNRCRRAAPLYGCRRGLCLQGMASIER
jgi:hypothetical protein